MLYGGDSESIIAAQLYGIPEAYYENWSMLNNWSLLQRNYWKTEQQTIKQCV